MTIEHHLKDISILQAVQNETVGMEDLKRGQVLAELNFEGSRVLTNTWDEKLIFRPGEVVALQIIFFDQGKKLGGLVRKSKLDSDNPGHNWPISFDLTKAYFSGVYKKEEK